MEVQRATKSRKRTNGYNSTMTIPHEYHRRFLAAVPLLAVAAGILSADAFVPRQQQQPGTRLAFAGRSKIREACQRPIGSSYFDTRLFSDDFDDEMGDDGIGDMGDDGMGDMGDVGDMDDDYIEEDFEMSDVGDMFVIDVDGDNVYNIDAELAEAEADDDDEEPLEEDPYMGLASSEFLNDPESASASSALATTNGAPGGSTTDITTDLDWGGALGSLRNRVEDVESGASQDSSQALFRMMSAPSPNQMIGQFVSSANPQVVQAMSGAVTSLLGGLSNPNMGIDVQVKASGEKIGSLCFQLQMTGYMFRNAEYVLALKDLMKLKGKKLTLADYKDAFDRVDTDRSGYIELSEIQDLFKEAYGGNEDEIPAYEIRTFLEFFDTNEDGRISWEEFEQGLASQKTREAGSGQLKSARDDLADRVVESVENAAGDFADEEDEPPAISEQISGTIEIEMNDGKIVTVDAEEYMESLKEEARKLKLALRQEKGQANPAANPNDPMAGLLNNPAGGAASDQLDIAGYISSRQGDVKTLTEGIKPEVVETMKKLVEFVLDGSGDARDQRNRREMSPQQKAAMELEIPGAALQQLALWQLVLGYRLREEEAKGDYVKLLGQ